jgi:hypothetical protein
LANGIEQKRIRNQWAPARRRWTKLGYDAIAVRDQHSFASSRQPDVFAELVFEQFDPDRPNALKVATGSYFVNHTWIRSVVNAGVKKTPPHPMFARP